MYLGESVKKHAKINPMTTPLVSSKWLHENINNPDLIILDASESTNKAGETRAYNDQKLPKSRCFNIKSNFSDPKGEFPNTFPTAKQFENGCRILGINNSSLIVVYDNLGIYTSPRVWWMFKTMGHENVHVLNGGLPDWIDNGFETDEFYYSNSQLGDFTANLQSDQVRSINFIKTNITDQGHLVIDARSEGRFNGTAKEPREGLRSGHIPNSVNIPFGDLLENGKYKSKADLKEIFERQGVSDQSLVFSCGSGITACIVLLAAEMIMDNPTSVYDGSWTEWATLMND